MNHIETMTRYTANFVDELAKSGCKNVVISPGSRSTALALTIFEHPMIEQWMMIDERSAGFFALGMAKEKEEPIALVCTSGTAAANYYPAIIEAHYSRAPLIVLTADRPHELQDNGAPQSIDQTHLYGSYVKWFHEMALPDASSSMLQYVRRNASRAVYEALKNNPGTVHLNFPFREPLIPNFELPDVWRNGTQETDEAHHEIIPGVKELSDDQLDEIIKRVHGSEKGLIVCGPYLQQRDINAISMLSMEWNMPILADPLSGIRSGIHFKNNVIECYDAILRNSGIRRKLKPDFIIRFGATPVSKMYRFYLEEHHDVIQFVVENHDGYREPYGNRTTFIYADADLLCTELIDVGMAIRGSMDWLHRWQRMNDIAKEILLKKESTLTEGTSVAEIIDHIPAESTLFVGNSMSIRDVDTFFMCTQKGINLQANRGANGIDGVVSSALGVAAAGKHVTLLIGDLSFYHDLNGLLAAKHYQLDMTIVCVNNNGGGIFSFLPQAQDKKHFETLFATPLNIDFKHAVDMYGGTYRLPGNPDELAEALKTSYAQKGLTVIDVQTDRTENKKWHQEKWTLIESELVKVCGI